ncbi:MAG: c-type cytochrome [Anaerolineales bacterium]
MRKVLKWLGIILAVLVGLVVTSALVLYIMGKSTLNKTRTVTPPAISIPNDEVSLARGEHMVDVNCTSCHGADLAGDVLLDDPMIGTIYTANITGLADRRTNEQLVLAIRHAVGPEGRQIIAMPSEAFAQFSAEDLGAIIAYLKTVPYIDKDTPPPDLSFIAHIMVAAGVMGDIFAAEMIDHDQPFTAMPEIGANLAYGEYLTALCASCHGEDLSGAQSPIQGSPIAPNLTPGGGLVAWSETDFIQAMRTGVTPSRHQMDPEYMPWKSWAKFHDEELQAIWMYLASLPEREMNFE